MPACSLARALHVVPERGGARYVIAAGQRPCIAALVGVRHVPRCRAALRQFGERTAQAWCGRSCGASVYGAGARTTFSRGATWNPTHGRR